MYQGYSSWLTRLPRPAVARNEKKRCRVHCHYRLSRPVGTSPWLRPSHSQTPSQRPVQGGAKARSGMPVFPPRPYRIKKRKALPGSLSPPPRITPRPVRAGQGQVDSRYNLARFKAPEQCRYGAKCRFKSSCSRFHGDNVECCRVNCACEEENCLLGHPLRAGPARAHPQQRRRPAQPAGPAAHALRPQAAARVRCRRPLLRPPPPPSSARPGVLCGPTAAPRAGPVQVRQVRVGRALPQQVP
jgi:hypothetical protein